MDTCACPLPASESPSTTSTPSQNASQHFVPPAIAGLTPSVIIEYCDRCRWLHRATWVSTELLLTFPPPALNGITLVPLNGTDTAGRFRVWVYSRHTAEPADEDRTPFASMVWDRKTEGGFPELKVLKQRIRDVVDPGKSLGHSDKAHLNSSTPGLTITVFLLAGPGPALGRFVVVVVLLLPSALLPFSLFRRVFRGGSSEESLLIIKIPQITRAWFTSSHADDVRCRIRSNSIISITPGFAGMRQYRLCANSASCGESGIWYDATAAAAAGTSAMSVMASASKMRAVPGASGSVSGGARTNWSS